MFENLRVAVRLREPWEAADLGFVLLRNHWRPVLAAWSSILFPLLLILHIAFRHHLWIAPLVIWWLKPALDRLVLHVLARATFGEVPTTRDTLRSLPRIFRHGLLPSLLWRRFSPQRSLLLPVWQLEEQRGADFRKRCSVLLRRGQAQAVLLTVLCLLLQIAIGFSILYGMDFFTPASNEIKVLSATFASGSNRSHVLDIFLSFLPTLVMTILEPFYVASGFTLYLNRRVELEGWDLEISFRRLAERITRLLAKGSIALLLFLALNPALPLRSEMPRTQPREALGEVLKAPEFQITRKEKVLRWKGKPSEEREPVHLPKWMTRFFKWLGFSMKWVLISAAIATMGYVLWRNRRQIQDAMKGTPDPHFPKTLFGLDLRPDALPKDLESQAAQLWQSGHIREALALLYRGALVHLVHHGGVPLSHSATEGECLDRAKEALTPQASGYFAELTRTWQRVAYAGRVPEPGSETLCTRWSDHFSKAREVRP